MENSYTYNFTNSIMHITYPTQIIYSEIKSV